MPKKLTLADLAKRVDQHRDAGNVLAARVSQVERGQQTGQQHANVEIRLAALEKRVFPMPHPTISVAPTLDSMIKVSSWEVVGDTVIRQWGRSAVAMLVNKLVTELGRAK